MCCASAQTTNVLELGNTNLGNAISLEFNYGPDWASVTLGGKVNANEDVNNWRFNTGVWNLGVNLQLNETVDDEINLTLNLQHMLQLHTVDGGAGTIFSASWQILAEGYDDGAHNLTGPGGNRSHGVHFDRFYNHNFQFNKTTEYWPLDYDEIPTWTFTLQAVHVPEPSSIGFICLGGVVLLVYRFRKGVTH